MSGSGSLPDTAAVWSPQYGASIFTMDHAGQAAFTALDTVAVSFARCQHVADNEPVGTKKYNEAQEILGQLRQRGQEIISLLGGTSTNPAGYTG